LTKTNTDSFYQDEDNKEYIQEQEQKLKSAIWVQMELFSWVMRIDEPSEVIDMIINYVNEYFIDFPSIEEYFERRKYKKIEGETAEVIEEINQKLRYAVWEQKAFLEDTLEINDFTEVIMMMDILVYKSVLEYLPWRHL